MTVRRLKTYTGAPGFVYQYYFVGECAVSHARELRSTEYVFDVSRDRKTYFPVTVALPEHSVEAWESAHGRKLANPERYAAAKLRLFRGFDEISDLQNETRLVLSESLLEELLTGIGID